MRLASMVTLLAVAALVHQPSPPPAQETGAPRVLDSRLDLRAFAVDPAIVTPIGLAVDATDRLFVLESHTHVRPPDYQGPASDRIVVFVDADRDGRPERHWVFADGFEDGMNLAFSPAGELHLVTATAVWALHDRDRDGVSESRTQVVRLTRPAKVYDHAALLGLTFSADGWLYVSRGNTGGSPWRLEGANGSSVGGYGDGGNIVRCRPDGSDLQEFATGFWNPFDLKFDAHGRLLAADNDPDARGPNRLVHVIQGGDYGYKSLYGESGIHPYVAWNGELPGTLPYATPLGEAPAGVLVARRASLPADYLDDVLVSIWEERRVVRVSLSPKGVSVAGEATLLIEGGEDFRPVAFAADSRGTIYVTDWGQRQYPNHGRGRVWRLSTRQNVTASRARGEFETPLPDRGLDTLRALSDERAEFGQLRKSVASDDPFVRSAAIAAMSHSRFRDQTVAAAAHSDPRVRIGSLLALQRARIPSPEPLVTTLLADADPQVRRMAMIWAGSARLTSVERAVDEAVLREPRAAELFPVYLATLEQLTPEFARSYADQAAPYARQLKRVLRPRFLETFIADGSKPAALRALAIRHLGQEPPLGVFLANIARTNQSLEMRREAVRALQAFNDSGAGAALLAVVRDRANDAELRADALAALAGKPVDASTDAVTLLDDSAPHVRLEAARYLRATALTEVTRQDLARKAATIRGPDASALQAQLAFALRSPAGAHPKDAAGWEAALGSGRGDPSIGRRVFFSGGAACSACHAAEGRGGGLGPDLTNAGQSKTRRQILHAIVDPSADVAPAYQGWFIRTEAGEVHTGRQIDVGEKGRADLYVLGRGFITVERMREYGPMARSLMPDGLAGNITIDDMRHLLAFLQASR
jgi:putative membrane-bound dehydrogenase-like protein